jgi:predicted amidohydrolase YtcJ
MTESFDLVLEGGVCATPSGVAEADIGVRDGRIAAIGALARATATERIEARGLHVLPGVIDTHVADVQAGPTIGRWCRLKPDELEKSRAWIERCRHFWNERLDALEDLLAETQTEEASRHGNRR